MTPILEYLKDEKLHEDKNEARRMRYNAIRYILYDNNLYCRWFNQPLLRLVDEKKGEYILGEIHE